MPQYRTVIEFETTANPTEAEHALIAACKAGRICRLGDGTRPIAFSKSRHIRADLLRLLITGGSKDCGLADDGVWLEGAWITGKLNLRFAKAHGRTAITASVFIIKPDLTQTRFQQLSLQRCILPGIFAQGISVKGDVFLGYVDSSDTVDIAGARIGGLLDLDSAILNGKGGKALNGHGIAVGQSVILRRIQTVGRVDINGARIKGQLSLVGAIINGDQSIALDAQVMTVTEHFLMRKIHVAGTVNINGTQVGGQLSCVEATFDGGPDHPEKVSVAIQAQRLQVRSSFIWRKVRVVNGRVDLAAAQVSDLVDDIACWPKGHNALNLSGFSYDRILGAETNGRKRLHWIQQSGTQGSDTSPQPYSQLAKVLISMGHDRDARQVLIARERLLSQLFRKDRRVKPNGGAKKRLLGVWRDTLNIGHKVWDSISYYVVGYGYRPFNSVIALAMLFTITTFLAHFTWTEGSFAPNSDVVITSPGWTALVAMDCAPRPYGPCLPNPAETWSSFGQDGLDWDSFNRYGYAADLVIPILDLGQTDAWAPSKDRGDWGWWLWWLRWVLSGLGWVITGLGAAAVTGIIKRERG